MQGLGVTGFQPPLCLHALRVLVSCTCRHSHSCDRSQARGRRQALGPTGRRPSSHLQLSNCLPATAPQRERVPTQRAHCRVQPQSSQCSTADSDLAGPVTLTGSGLLTHLLVSTHVLLQCQRAQLPSSPLFALSTAERQQQQPVETCLRQALNYTSLQTRLHHSRAKF
jgi:hypothetical protein